MDEPPQPPAIVWRRRSDVRSYNGYVEGEIAYYITPFNEAYVSDQWSLRFCDSHGRWMEYWALLGSAAEAEQMSQQIELSGRRK